MLAINFGKRIFCLFLVAFFIHVSSPETMVNAQQKPSVPGEKRQPAPTRSEDECERLYKMFLENRKSTALSNQSEIAYRAGRQFIEKCDMPENQEIIKYLKHQLARMGHHEGEANKSILRFNNSVKDLKNTDADEAFASGAEILSRSPDLIDVMLVLASVGFDKATSKPPVNKYNGDAIYYAKLAIQKIESGKTSTEYGAYGYKYETKENALAWMNYTIGYISYFNQNDKKQAVPYLYKATVYETGTQTNPKNNAPIYQAIGDYYKDEYERLDDERVKLAAEAKDKSAEAERKPLTDKYKELLARQKIYAEKMLDAYARLYHLAGNQDKAYKHSLYNTLKILYRFRFDGRADGFDEYIKNVVNAPLPEPE
ncbi:MAG TPA: hypothetical protein VF599_16490 [Pyrinomonadaceae bacterium]|jgi:hypothetical protein